MLWSWLLTLLSLRVLKSSLIGKLHGFFQLGFSQRLLTLRFLTECFIDQHDR